jgi:T5SS/PEP-CTERM-associated repeat protein
VARTYTWQHPGTGNFDRSTPWVDITTGTPEAASEAPTEADIAEFSGVSPTVASVGIGTASTVTLASSVVTLIGIVQFGALDMTGSALDIMAGATLECAPAYQETPQTAVVVGAGSELAVTGAGASMTVRDTANANADLQLAATATLTVSAGASVSADILALAGSQTASALGSIDGGSVTTEATAELSASWLALGDGGMASLTATNGALVAAGIVTVGFGEARGAGAGTLLVTAAGQLAADSYAALGFAAGDVGAATIDGVGSAFGSAGLFVGNAGTGSLTVENGAVLESAVETGDTTSFAASLANASGAAGTVLVEGAGSTWRIAGRTDVGDGGPGTLDVLQGAAVLASVAPVAFVDNGATEYDGTFSFSQATVAVQGTGSTIDAGGGPVYIGNAGAANVSVSQGGAMSAGEPAPDYAAIEIGLNGGSGTLDVTDVGSELNAAGQIDVGGSGGTGDTGTLNVLAGATLFSGGQSADPTAGLSVGDGAGSSGFASLDGVGSVLSNNGRLDIGRNGSGVLSITNAAIVTTALSTAAQADEAASVLVGVDAGANGEVFLAGTNSELIASEGMIVGLGGTGTLQVIDAAQVHVGGGLGIGNAFGSGFTGSGTGLVSVVAGSLAVGGTLAIGDSEVGYAGSGTLSIAAGAQVSVAGSATITAGSTVELDSGGLQIGGAGGGAVTGMLIDAGATLAGAGAVQGSATVEGAVAASGGVLALTRASGPGTFSVVAGGILDIGSLSGGTVDFAGNGTLRLHATASGSALIVGSDGGTIDMVGLAADNPAYVGGSLTVDVGAGRMTLELAEPPPPGAPTIVSDGAGGTDIVLACFAAGTRLVGPSGSVAVEEVRVGDLLGTASGGPRRVVWVGQRTLDCRLHPRPAEVQPVRVRAGAFAPAVPGRDVLLSPDHALFVEGSLIPVRYLINGRSIAQEPASRITYCHVELASHDVLLAEGLPCESFLDTGNRHAFAAQGGPVALHPAFACPVEFSRAVWAEKGCAPLVLEGPALERARRHLLRRAAALGHRRTRNPALRVFCAGHALRAEVAGSRWQVALPPGTTEVWLASRRWVPAHMRPREIDARVLGVAISRLMLDGGEMALDSPALAEGWHQAERDWRWTDGSGVLPVAGSRLLAFDLAMVGEYWVTPPAAVAARRSGG